MSYTSFKFLVFVCITAIAYFLFPSKKYQWTVLLAASYIFYLFAGYKYVAFLLITTATTYLSALWIDKITQNSKAELKAHKADWDKDQKKEYKNRIKGQKKAIMVAMVVLNLGILAFLFCDCRLYYLCTQRLFRTLSLFLCQFNLLLLFYNLNLNLCCFNIFLAFLTK